MQKYFEQNSSIFQVKNPRASALFSLTDADHLQFCSTKKGEKNLVHQGETPIFYHSQEGALQESMQEMQALNLSNVLCVCIYGLGLGYSYLALKKWLEEDKNRSLIFLEDDLAVIMRFLETKEAASLLEDPQVHIYYLEMDREEELHELIEKICWGVFPHKMKIIPSGLYGKYRKDDFQKIQHKLFYELAELDVVLDEYLSYGAHFFRNFWVNLFEWPASLQAGSLFKKFKNVPAICVAAGPSLNKQIPLLRTLSDKALILAGGSSTNALTQAGIQPHFTAGIDPNPTQYLRLRQNLAFEVPFFYRGRLFHPSLKTVSGQKIYLRGGDGYNISDFFEKRFKVKGSILGGGHSVANFLIEIAHALGCRPIILIGYDLAYTGDEAYARGVEDSESKDNNIASETNVSDYQGKPITTLYKWLVEADWIKEYKENHPKLPLINATEGGLKLEGLKHMTFQEACCRFLHTSYDIEGLRHLLLQKAPSIDCHEEKIVDSACLIYKSLEKAISALDSFLDTAKKVEDKKDTPLSENPELTLIFEKLQKEAAFKYVLDIFHRMHTKLDYYKLQYAFSPKMTSLQKNALEKEVILKHFFFLKEVALVNRLLIHRTLKTKNLSKKAASLLKKAPL